MELDPSEFKLGNYDGTNALALPSKRVKHQKEKVPVKRKVRVLSKKQRKKLEKIVEKRGKKQNRAELLLELQKHQLPQSVYDSFTPLVKVMTIGQKKLFAGSMRKKNKNQNLGQNSDEKLTIMEEEDACLGSESSEHEDAEESERINVFQEEIQVNGSESKINQTNSPISTPTVPINQKTNPVSYKFVKCTPHPHSFVEVQRTEDIEKIRSKLPIIPEEQVIMEAISENLVTVLTGETGSGKTTQLPQFLYEAGYANPPKLIGYPFILVQIKG